EPVVQLEALLQLGLELGVPGAEVGGGGNIAGTIDFDLNGALNGTASGPVKLYLDQIASALATNPFSLFNTSGEISAGFNAYASLGLLGYTYNSPRIVLGEFSTGAEGAPLIDTWTGATDNNWSNPGNWDSGKAPASADSVIIPNASPAILVDQATIANLQISSGGQLQIDASDGSAAGLTVNGEIENAGTIVLVENGTAELTAGFTTLSGGGVVDLTHGGTINGINSHALVTNLDNFVVGHGQVDVAFVNSGSIVNGVVSGGVVEAQGGTLSFTSHVVANYGLIEAAPDGEVFFSGSTLNNASGGVLNEAFAGQFDFVSTTIIGGTFEQGLTRYSNGYNFAGTNVLSGPVDLEARVDLIAPVGGVTSTTLVVAGEITNAVAIVMDSD